MKPSIVKLFVEKGGCGHESKLFRRLVRFIRRQIFFQNPSCLCSFSRALLNSLFHSVQENGGNFLSP